ncbi:hypothetical protein [Nonomuraea cavernae]|uniref:Uncharacterized protein n=1 Tax=Nonomuraea cavernae TaxID=2045107 RepID=A0A917Z3U1_9ACTN|nr:hypothetical protein [Nonomuraea cavernae]MCA2187879.1 hypothetical protein [Nonomuraea cavernae]GGO72130.1 hypothetical protein GCM10012289_39460 [Nonomuraea cavernae]
MSILKRTIRTAAVLAGATAALLGLGTVSAHAGTAPGVMAKPRLTINKLGGDQCQLTVITTVGMTQAQAQYQVDNRATARIEVWADDLVYDNRVYKAPNALMTASKYDGGLIITAQPKLPCFYLDEDQSQNFDAEGDEIYVKVVFEGPGYSRMAKNSNVVNGRW